MSRSLRAVGWAFALAVLAAGCQDYNFNPVGHCVIQPGTKRVTLSNISSADVLFVVDDSGSMWDEQQRIAQNFSRFIQNLDDSNAARVSNGLEAFDFHLAVSTTSVFYNPQTSATCSSTCPGASGQLVCCAGAVPARQPKKCTSDAQCTVAGTACRTTCNTLKGESYCCAGDGTFPTGSISELIPCSSPGIPCGGLETHYDFGSCTTSGVAAGGNGFPYPQGDFVSWTSGATANPRVLHFDKQLYTGGAGTNGQGFTSAQLVDFFKGIDANGTQGNVMVGTCGSGQEQALNAARGALQKAAAGKQADTYKVEAGAASQPALWNSTTRTAGASAEFLHPNAKLVLVFVGDEDDCSSPADPSGGVVMLPTDSPGLDACNRDANASAPLGQKEYATQSFVDYFTGLGRPVGAAFIFPAAQESCTADTCTAGPGQCSTAQAPGYRLLATSQALRAKGADVVVGSICDPNFGDLLDSIADLVKPPSGLSLPTLPAAGDVTLLRIATADGVTRKVCSGPLAPGSYATPGDAEATKVGWWFTQTADPGVPVAGPTQFVYINRQGDCRANAGETYSADYIGQLPSGGCWDDAAYAPQGAETNGDAMCRTILGGTAGSWTCFSEASNGTCAPSVPSSAPGTCICGARAANCAP